MQAPVPSDGSRGLTLIGQERGSDSNNQGLRGGLGIFAEG